MATFTKRGAVWMARVRKKGISKTATFPTKGKAQAWATQIESEILAGVAQDHSDKRFIDALEKYAAEVSVNKRGARWELVRIEKFKRLDFAYYRLSDVTTPRLAAWRDEQLKSLKSSSVSREMNLLSSIFEQARREWHWISINPVKDVRRPPQPKHRERLFTDAEADLICRALGWNGESVELKKQIVAAAFLFALETGMRREEITGLHWDRVSIQRRFVSLARTKNEDARDVPLSPRAVEILGMLKSFQRPFEVDKDSLSTQFRRACIKAGIVDAHFHDARATALTRLSKIYNVVELARIIGHRDPRSLMIYYRETAENLASKMWASIDDGKTPGGPEKRPARHLKIV